MKKLLSIILSATMLLGVVGCGSANNNAETTASTDKIIVGLDDQFPPMGFRDDKNELVGFDIDLAKAAAEKMGCKIEFQPIDWEYLIYQFFHLLIHYYLNPHPFQHGHLILPRLKY